MNNWKHTRTKLTQLRLHLQHQLALVNAAAAGLHPDNDILFQVHIQENAPDRRSIMAEGRHLATVMERAERLWKEYHPTATGRPRMELFIRLGDILVAVDKEDAGADFFFDSRIGNYPDPIVFGREDVLPSGWYLTTPTPELCQKAIIAKTQNPST